jgi:hypothetical protein
MGKKQLPEDFKDFIKLLNANNVEYLLVGGWAVAIHGLILLKKQAALM